MRILLLPPGEGRDEGRLRSSSLNGSGSHRRKPLASFLSMNFTGPNPPKPAVRVLLLPPGEGRDEGRLRSSSLNGSGSHREKPLASFLSMNFTGPNPPKPAVRVLLLPPGEGRDEGRSRSSSLDGSGSQCVSIASKTRLSLNHDLTCRLPACDTAAWTNCPHLLVLNPRPTGHRCRLAVPWNTGRSDGLPP